MLMGGYEDYKKKVLQTSEVKNEYDALGSDYDII